MERRVRRKFTPEFKARTVELIRTSGQPIAHICRELDLGETAVRRWVLQAQVDAGAREGLSTAEREELTRLRKENRVLREEREILRKAAAFFAKQDETR
jgi:transposase